MSSIPMQDLEQKMTAELEEALAKCLQDVKAFVEPLEQHSQSIVSQIEALLKQQETLMEELVGIQQQAANIE